MLFLLRINCYLRAVEEHYYLHRDTPTEKSLLQFMMNPKGVRCIVYQEDSVMTSHDGGLKDMRRERKTGWIYPNLGNTNRCPVRLIEKYLKLCPAYHKKSNYYLQSLQKLIPTQWYGEQVVGQNTISKVVKTLMSDAKIEGFFTNHSTRRTGGTRLFRAGVDRKLVKEATGHSSDAVNKYQLTSDEQREKMSKIVQGQTLDRCVESAKAVASVTVSQPNDRVYNCKSHELEVSNVGGMINDIIEKQKM